MSTPTPMPRTCGEISCDECNDRYAALAAECDQLRAEVERLRSDRDCEKRLRKDADEFRENAIARAERADRAEAELATERARLDWLLLDVVSRFDDAYYTRSAIDAAMKEGSK